MAGQKSRKRPAALTETLTKATQARKAAKREAQAARQRANVEAAKEGLMTPWQAAQSQRLAKRRAGRVTEAAKAAALVHKAA